MFDRIREDIATAFEKDPAARSTIEVLTTYPGLHAIWIHRLVHPLWEAGFFRLARFISHIARFLTGVEIHPGAEIGRRFFIDHGGGVVIGETAEIGDDVVMFQGCTLGGTSRKREKRHPTIEDEVVIGAGAILLGPITVGEGARIGAGSVVLDDVEPESTMVGVPAEPAGESEPEERRELRHDEVEDPVHDRLEELEARLDQIERELAEVDVLAEARLRDTEEEEADTEPADGAAEAEADGGESQEPD